MFYLSCNQSGCTGDAGSIAAAEGQRDLGRLGGRQNGLLRAHRYDLTIATRQVDTALNPDVGGAVSAGVAHFVDAGRSLGLLAKVDVVEPLSVQQ